MSNIIEQNKIVDMNRGYMLHLFQKLKIVIISDVNNLIAEKKKEDTGEGGGGGLTYGWTSIPLRGEGVMIIL